MSARKHQASKEADTQRNRLQRELAKNIGQDKKDALAFQKHDPSLRYFGKKR